VIPADQVYVQPGDIYWSEDPLVFRTILGSCVSVCLWDEIRGFGGLTHFVLPSARGGEHGGRFGDFAVPWLVNELRNAGCKSLVAKVFGGASVLGSGEAATVGDSNVQMALALLETARIPIVARRTGGTRGVVLMFYTATGDVDIRVMEGNVLPTVVVA